MHCLRTCDFLGRRGIEGRDVPRRRPRGHTPCFSVDHSAMSRKRDDHPELESSSGSRQGQHEDAYISLESNTYRDAAAEDKEAARVWASSAGAWRRARRHAVTCPSAPFLLPSLRTRDSFPIPRYGTFDAYVEVEDARLTEYDVKETVDKDGVPCITCWIPSEAGKVRRPQMHSSSVLKLRRRFASCAKMTRLTVLRVLMNSSSTD
jgi:hypothetical protein